MTLFPTFTSTKDRRGLPDGPEQPTAEFLNNVTGAIKALEQGNGNGTPTGPTVDTADVGYDLVLLLGQSNMQGDSAGTTAANVDVNDPRVWTFGATGTYAGQIVQGSDPLAHRGGSSVVGPGMSFARWYAGTVPGNRRVLLVPAAANGTAFGSGTPRWDPTTSWPNDSANLYNLAIAQAQAALAAAGMNARLVAVLWAQGESDALAGLAAAGYRTYLEQLIDGFRSRLSLPNLPFVIGSMLPEFIAGSSTAQAIDGVHQATPTRKRYTAYVAGPSGMQRGDNLHYSPAGQREQGRRMLVGLAAAKANSAPSGAVADAPPTAPVQQLTNTALPAITGTATTGQTLTVSNGTWSATPDGYTYQWRRGGTAISGATSSTYVLQVADEGQATTATVTAVKAGYTSGSATSTAAGTGGSVADNFNRADSTSSLGGTSTAGVPWTAVLGTWGISGNQAYQPSGVNGALATVPVSTANHYAEAKFSTPDGGTCVVVRCSDANNWYALLGSALYKRVAGTTTPLGNFGSFTAGDTMRLSVSGSTLTAYRNGTQVGQVTDTALTTGNPGLRCDSSSGRFDDFAAGTTA